MIQNGNECPVPVCYSPFRMIRIYKRLCKGLKRHFVCDYIPKNPFIFFMRIQFEMVQPRKFCGILLACLCIGVVDTDEIEIFVKKRKRSYRMSEKCLQEI